LELSKQILENKAKSSEIALITTRNAGENADRNVENDFNLAIDEINLIDDVATAFMLKAKVVVVLNIGGVIETASWKNKVDAILLPWQPDKKEEILLQMF
jgi:beta-glucosidase